MIKILGREIKGDYSVRSILDRIYGIGYKKAKKICNDLLIYPQCTIRELSPERIKELNGVLEQMEVGPKLKIKELEQKKKLFELGTVKGKMLKEGLPVNGQRYSENASTAKKLNPRWVIPKDVNRKKGDQEN